MTKSMPPEALAAAAMPRTSLRPKPIWRRFVFIAAPAALLVGGGAAWLAHGEPPAAAAAALASVTVSSPLLREVNLWDEYVGRFAASQAVEVRPRVSGAVTAVHFQDGQMVQKGQLLFSIDERPFAAALAEARAALASAVSGLDLARSDYARASRLTGDEALAAGEIDGLRARVRAAEAAQAAAEARVRARALDMEFTKVRAPIAGRVSDRRIDTGNLVSGGEGGAGSLLTTINALDPIYFEFDASEALYLKSRHHGQGSAAPVEIKLQDEGDYRWKGRLDFTDNGVDARSGTIRGRAVLANPDHMLTPGLFGNMRMGNGDKAQAMLVPATAIQSDQAHKAVLVVGSDDVVAVRQIELGPEVDGLRVVASGVRPTDRIVIGGAIAAIPGTKVHPVAGVIRPTPDAKLITPAVSAAQATFATTSR